MNHESPQNVRWDSVRSPNTIPGVKVDETCCPRPVPGDFDRMAMLKQTTWVFRGLRIQTGCRVRESPAFRGTVDAGYCTVCRRREALLHRSEALGILSELAYPFFGG